MALAWPGTWRSAASGSSRWTAPTGRTGEGKGKSDPLDAVSAARAAQSGRAAGAPKGRDGAVEAIRALMVAKRSARGERAQAINQARALILTGPEELRARFARHSAAALAAGIAALRPRPGDAAGYAVRVALRELGRRVEFPDAQIERLDDLIIPLVTARAPGLLSLYGVGPDTAALLLIAAGDHPERLRSEAAWAHMCAVAPIPASSGKTRRHRLNRGGNREANHALWRIVITRMSAHPATRAYVQRRTAEGLSKKDIIRCLKRYVAREVYPYTCSQAPDAAKPPGRPGPLIGLVGDRLRRCILVDDRPAITGMVNPPPWKHVLFDAPYNRGQPGPRLSSWADWRAMLTPHLQGD
jgi:transposase